jgi:hypothetical protein
MLRKTMILLATAAALTGGLTADAFARGGGGGGGGGHGGGFGGAQMGRGFSGGAHMGGFGGGTHLGGGFGRGHFGRPGVAFGRGFAGQHFAATRGHFGHDMHFGRGRSFAPGWGGPYGYYDNSGYYVPSTAAPDEQPAYPTTIYPYVEPPRSSCSTQTYKVQSETGGEASVNVVRC